MKTILLNNEIGSCADIIRGGGLVGVPTETVYGLACNALDDDAVRKVYEVKNRPQEKKLAWMVHGKEAIDRYCVDVPVQAYALAGKYWPGPLTIILNTPDGNVGLRCPDSPLTLKLLQEADIPFAVPSANPSGAESPKTAAQVMEYFDGLIDAVIDGGECRLGVASTVLDMTHLPYKVLRPGAVSEEELADALVDVMTVIGITGQTGSGKTTALKELTSEGALVIDCDEVYHGLLNDCREMLCEIGNSFPEAFDEGRVDRKKLASSVFSDESRLTLLNEITHKYVKAEVMRLLRNHAMNGGLMAAVDAVELISGGLSDLCDKVIGITADRELRIQRITARDSISREEAEKRVDAQKDAEYYRRNCDAVVENNGNLEMYINSFRKAIDNGKHE